MIDKDWTFLLGAQDPEMREIERVLDDQRPSWPHTVMPAGIRQSIPRLCGRLLAGTNCAGDRGPLSGALLRQCARRGPR